MVHADDRHISHTIPMLIFYAPGTLGSASVLSQHTVAQIMFADFGASQVAGVPKVIFVDTGIEHCYELPKEETVDIFMSNVVGAKEDLVVSLVKAAQILHVLSSRTGLDGHVTFHDIGNTTVRP